MFLLWCYNLSGLLYQHLKFGESKKCINRRFQRKKTLSSANEYESSNNMTE